MQSYISAAMIASGVLALTDTFGVTFTSLTDSASASVDDWNCIYNVFNLVKSFHIALSRVASM